MAIYPASDFTEYQDILVPQTFTLIETFYDTIEGRWCSAKYIGSDKRYVGQRFTVYLFAKEQYVDAPCPPLCNDDHGLKISLKPQFTVEVN